MTTEEIFNIITSNPKWYAGIEYSYEKYYNAQSANRIKDRFKRGVLSDKIIERIFNKHSYFKNETTWKQQNKNLI